MEHGRQREFDGGGFDKSGLRPDCSRDRTLRRRGSVNDEWGRSESFDPEKGRFVTWMLTVTRRLAIDRLRLWQRREPQRATLFIDENPQLWEQLLAVDGYTDLRGSLVSAIRELPEAQRQAIELAYFYGMSHSDIAEYLQAPLGTVKTRIRQGMQKLRTAWADEAPGHLKVED